MFWNPALLAFSIFINDQEYLAAAIGILAGLALFSRRKVFFEAAATVGLSSFALKLFFHQARPCLEQAAMVACPPDFGFPSGHAAFSGLLLAGSLGSPWAWIVAPIALLVSYSRIYVGVHTPEQVVGGFALAVAVYLAVWRLNAEGNKP